MASLNPVSTAHADALHYTTYDRDDHLSHDVCDPRHPDHADFIGVLSDPVLRDPIVDMWQLAAFVDTFDSQRFCA